MALDSSGRLGWAGLIMALFGIAATYIWPDKKWIGWVCLVLTATLVLWWGTAEIRQYFGGGQKSETAQVPQPASEPKPEITADFVQGTSPGLLLMNRSATVIKDPVGSYGMWNLSKIPPLMIPSWEVRESGAFIKQNSGRILATADTPQAKPYIAVGDRIFALIIVDCPDCRSSRIYYLYFVYGEPSNSWFSEVPEGAASNVLLVNGLLQRSGWNVEKFLATVPHLPVRNLEPPTGLLVAQP
jgi:hypothetical protein